MPYDDAPEGDTLERLRLAALGGQARALDDLVRALEPLVMRRCARFLPHRADAEEACQDALVSIATKLGSFSGRGSFVGSSTRRRAARRMRDSVSVSGAPDVSSRMVVSLAKR